jgi:hypothetical protein
MSTLITWNPFGELDELQNRLGGLFFNGFPNRMEFPNPMGNGDALLLTSHRLQFPLPRVYSLRFLFSYTSWARTNR